MMVTVRVLGTEMKRGEWGDRGARTITTTRRRRRRRRIASSQGRRDWAFLVWLWPCGQGLARAACWVVGGCGGASGGGKREREREAGEAKSLIGDVA